MIRINTENAREKDRGGELPHCSVITFKLKMLILFQHFVCRNLAHLHFGEYTSVSVLHKYCINTAVNVKHYLSTVGGKVNLYFMDHIGSQSIINVLG